MERPTVYLTEGLEAFCDLKDRALVYSVDSHDDGHSTGFGAIRWGDFSAAWHGLHGTEVVLRQRGFESRLGGLSIFPECTLEIFHLTDRSQRVLLQPKLNLHTYVFNRMGMLVSATVSQENLPFAGERASAFNPVTPRYIVAEETEIISRELERGATGNFAIRNRQSRFRDMERSESTSLLSWE